jgi:carbonic anhydrase/acetyltransferase-like protein (isoleucine patch superfamily)
MAHQFNPQDVQCTEALVNAPHIYYGSTRNRYCNWQFFEFVKDNSCPEFVNDGLWRNGIKPEDPSHWTADPFSTLAGNAAWSVSELNDIFADWALHNVLWDYRTSGKTFRSKYGSNRDVNGVRRFRVTRLQPTESVGEYKVPSFWAPQRWGYNLVELVPDQSRDHIWVDFEGVVQDSPAVNTLPSGFKLQPEAVDQPNSSWRWSVVVVQGDDTPRYSELQRGSAGRLRVNLKVNDKSVWLVVMATPSKIQKIFWDQIYYSIYRYPWKLRLDGAKPAQFEPVLVGAGAPHQNGGGWVSATAKVDAGVYVAEAAKILGNARVTGSARVEDFAIVQGSASVSGNAIIKGYALVSGSAIVKGESIVEDYAAILGGTVQDQARVGALSLVEGGSIIGGNSVVLATMNSVNGRSVSGNTQLIGDVELNTSVSRGIFYGFIDATTAVDSGLGAGRTQPPTEITVVDR